jgi:hypothetical protein
VRVDFSPEAQAAWQAYLVMRQCKTDYFSLLSEIDRRARDGGAPASIAESLLLEKRLAGHGAAVQTFSNAMAAVTDTGAREALIRAISAEASK